MPEGKNGHVCVVKKPKPPKHFERLAFYDYETFTVPSQNDMHYVNAVGFTYEDRTVPGLFHEITFYDQDLQHSQNAAKKEGVFFYKYWTSFQNVQELTQWHCPQRRARLRLEERLARRQTDRRDYDECDPADDEDQEELIGGYGTSDHSRPITPSDFFISEAVEDRYYSRDSEDNSAETDEEGQEAEVVEKMPRVPTWVFLLLPALLCLRSRHVGISSHTLGIRILAKERWRWTISWIFFSAASPFPPMCSLLTMPGPYLY